MSEPVGDAAVSGGARLCYQCRNREIHAAGLCQRHYLQWYYLKRYASHKYRQMVENGFDRESIARPRTRQAPPCPEPE